MFRSGNQVVVSNGAHGGLGLLLALTFCCQEMDLQEPAQRNRTAGQRFQNRILRVRYGGAPVIYQGETLGGQLFV